MNRKLAITGALVGVVLLSAACLPGAQPRPITAPSLTEQAASNLPAPTGVAGSIVNNRATLNWSAVSGARDYVIFDVSTGQPGRVVGRVTGSAWTSVNLPGRESFTWQVVARDAAKVEGARSQAITLYPAGAPTEPTPTPTPEPTTPPTTEPTEPTPTTPPPARAMVRDEPVDLGAAVSLARLQDPVYRQTVIDYFGSITAENEMKPRLLQPRRGVFDYTNADQIVAFAKEHGKEIRGHTLFWHGANPSWLTNGSFTQAEWAQLIRDHATNVVGHFKGDITSWDVLNEIVAEDGSGLRTDNPWVQGYGGDPLDAIELMFRAAHEADPTARLCINDFSVEFNRPKTEAYYNLVRDLLARGVPIDCVGFQSHLITEQEAGTSDPGGWSPTVEELTGILQRFADLGVTVQLTEADLKTSPTAGSTADKLQAHAEMAAVLAQACQNVEACTELTWWGVNDSQSWLGPNEMTLLFSDTVTDDGTFRPKPAYWATREIIGGGPTAPTEPATPPAPVDPEPEQPAAQPIRTWDVDPGDTVFDVWPEIHAPSHARVRVSTEQVFPGEDASLKFTINRGENGNPGASSTWKPGPTGTLRAEVRDSIAASGNIAEGTEQWWSWANYFPADFNWDERNQFFGFMQFHQTANSGNPPVHFWSDEQENVQLDLRGGTGGRTGGDAQHTERHGLGPVVKGAWNPFVLHVVWSADPNKGLVEVYRDGELVLSERAANLYAGQSAYVKQGIYSANGTADEPIQTIYTSTTRRGDSLEAVRPPSD